MIEINNGVTFINGKQVSSEWKYASNGKTFSTVRDCILFSDMGLDGGVFQGYWYDINRQMYHGNCQAKWNEFTIYDENGGLIQEAEFIQ